MEDRGNLRGRRVLVVDDEPYILKILVFKLRTAGLVPIEAADGESALSAALADRPDAVLLDVSLSPGVSGFDVLERLKEDPRTVIDSGNRPDRPNPPGRAGHGAATRCRTLPDETVLDEGAPAGA